MFSVRLASDVKGVQKRVCRAGVPARDRSRASAGARRPRRGFPLRLEPREEVGRPVLAFCYSYITG